MAAKIYTINEIKNIVSPIAERYGVERVYLFGSYARGEATETSDLDFRIDRGKLKGLLALGGMYDELQTGFGKKLDPLTTAGLDSGFLKNISKEEVLVYEAS